MKVYTNQIPVEGLYLEGEEPAGILDIEDVKVLSPVRYRLNIGMSEGGLFATGQLAAEIEVECVNCLSHFPYTLEVPDFALQIPLDGREMADLTPNIREDMVLALPLYPHCDWNGETICKGPRIKHEPEPDPVEPEAWEALDKLNLKKEK